MVTTFYPPYSFGGDGIAIQHLSQALVRAGHEVTVLQDIDGFNVLRPGAEPAVPAASDGVEVIRLRSRAPLASALLTQQTGRPVVQGGAIRRFLDERRFDVVNFHNVSLAGGPGVRLGGGEPRKLYMAHEHWLVCPSHVLWRHNREPCTGRECLRCVLEYRRPPQLWRHTGPSRAPAPPRRRLHRDERVQPRQAQEFGFPRDMEVVNFFLPDASGADRGCAGGNRCARAGSALWFRAGRARTS